jgi:hypothetical protein
MPEIYPDRLEAALIQLEGERERRLQARVDAGELVLVTTHVVVHRGESVEEATARAIDAHPIPDDHHRELFFIFTGVPRGRYDYGNDKETSSPQITASSKGPLSSPAEETAGSGAVLSSAATSQPTYVRITISNGDEDGDPGQISEALWSVDEDGCVVLTTLEGKHITSRALLKNEDPLTVARALLREREASSDFQAPIHYPKLGLA